MEFMLPECIFVKNNLRNMKSNIHDYVNNEFRCDTFFNGEGPFWHLCTDGEKQEIIFKNEDDYKYGITSSALAIAEINSNECKVKIYAFAVMSNHIHEILAGRREDCLEYFKVRKAKLKRYFGKSVDLDQFKLNLIDIIDVKSLRNEIAYVHRNGFVNNLRETPFSYRWSTGMYYFNYAAKHIPNISMASLSHRRKRELLKVAIREEYNMFNITEGYISPLSFCKIEEGEAMFRDAHQYFYKISKAVEAYSLIAKRLGDRIFLNDDEMLNVIYRKAKELYNSESPNQLNKTDKMNLARIMHHEYNASNSQIHRMLKIDRSVIDNIFPKAQ